MKEIKIERLEDSVVITIPREKNYTLEDLRQKLINRLYQLKYFDNNDTKILEVLFETKKD